MALSEIKLVVGLGNPGSEYAGTRHNAGFMAAARLMEKLNVRFDSVSRYESEIFTGRAAGRNLAVQLPTTYMNRSGEAVRKLMAASGVLPEELLVIYDDMDLPFGRIRLRESGSSGGHKGVASIIAEIGSEAFSRLRIGIGSPESSKVVDFVLSPFPEAEKEELLQVLSTAADAVRLALARGVPEAMNRYNNWKLKTKEEQAGAAAKEPPAAM